MVSPFITFVRVEPHNKTVLPYVPPLYLAVSVSCISLIGIGRCAPCSGQRAGARVPQAQVGLLLHSAGEARTIANIQRPEVSVCTIGRVVLDRAMHLSVFVASTSCSPSRPDLCLCETVWFAVISPAQTLLMKAIGQVATERRGQLDQYHYALGPLFAPYARALPGGFFMLLRGLA